MFAKAYIPRVKSAIKATIAGLSSAWVYLYFQLPFGFLATVVGVMVLAPTIGSSKEKGWVYLIGLSLGFIVGLVFINYLVYQPFLCFMVLALWTLFCIYIMKIPSIGKTSFLTAGMTFLTVATATLEPNITISSSIALIVAFALGIFSYWLIDHLLWPHYAYLDIAENIAVTITDCQSLFNRLLDEVVLHKSKIAEIKSLSKSLRKQISRNYRVLSDAKKELRQKQGLENGALLYYTELDMLYMNIITLSNSLLDTHNVVYLSCINKITAPQYYCNLLFDDLKARFKRKTTLDFTLLDKTKCALENLSRQFQKLGQDSTKAGNHSLDFFENFHHIIYSLQNIVDNLDNLYAVSEILKQYKHNSSIIKKTPSFWYQAKKIFKPVDWLQIGYACKVIITVGIVFYIQQYFHWEIGNSAIATAFIVTSPWLGKTLQITHWRFSGIIYGALFGMLCVSILTIIPAFWLLMSLLGLALFTSAMLVTGTARSAYVGVQGMVAFVLIIFPSPMLTGMLETGLNRVLGVLLGGITAISISFLLFPYKAKQQLKQNLANSLMSAGECYRLLMLDKLNHAKNRGSVINRLQEKIKENISENTDFLEVVTYEGGNNQAQHNFVAMMHEIDRVFVIVLWIQNLFEKFQAVQISQYSLEKLQKLNHELIQWIEQLAENIVLLSRDKSYATKAEKFNKLLIQCFNETAKQSQKARASDQENEWFVHLGKYIVQLVQTMKNIENTMMLTKNHNQMQ